MLSGIFDLCSVDDFFNSKNCERERENVNVDVLTISDIIATKRFSSAFITL